MDDNFITTLTASNMSNISERSLRRFIENGTLKAKKNSDGKWQISEKDFKNFLITQQIPQQQIEINSTKVKEVNKLDFNHTEYKDEILSLKEENRYLRHEMKEEIKEYREEIRSLREENKALRHEMFAILTGNFKKDTLSPWTRSGETNKKDNIDIIEHIEEKKEETARGYSLKELEALLKLSKNTIKRKIELLEKNLNTKIDTVIIDKQGTKHYIINDEQIILLTSTK